MTYFQKPFLKIRYDIKLKIPRVSALILITHIKKYQISWLNILVDDDEVFCRTIDRKTALSPEASTKRVL